MRKGSHDFRNPAKLKKKRESFKFSSLNSERCENKLKIVRNNKPIMKKLFQMDHSELFYLMLDYNRFKVL